MYKYNMCNEKADPPDNIKKQEKKRTDTFTETNSIKLFAIKAFERA